MIIDNNIDEYESGTMKTYTTKLINSRPDFLRMIYDSYLSFDFEELENSITFQSSTENNLKHPLYRQLTSKLSQKGFYKNEDQFLKGYELDKWNTLIGNIMDDLAISQNGKPTNKKKIKEADGEFKKVEFMKINEIPNTPAKKFNLSQIQQKNVQLALNTPPILKFNFKSKDNRIISFPTSSNLNSEKLKEYIKEHLLSSGNEDLIKLTDVHRDNRMVLFERIETVTENGVISLKNELDLESLQMRADLLVIPRLLFIQKVACTVCKFIVAVKNLIKKRKEKEKFREFNNNNSAGSLIKKIKSNNSDLLRKDLPGEKLKKVAEIVSYRAITNLMNNNKNKSVFGIGPGRTNKTDLKKFKKKLASKVENKEKSKKIDKIMLIKQKMKNISQYGDEYQKSEEYINIQENKNNLQSEYNDDEQQEQEYLYNTRSKEYINNEDLTKSEIKSQNNKRRSLANSQIVDMIEDISEEKIIIPKKKINHPGLKMFIKEEFNKINKKLF